MINYLPLWCICSPYCIVNSEGPDQLSYPCSLIRALFSRKIFRLQWSYMYVVKAYIKLHRYETDLFHLLLCTFILVIELIYIRIQWVRNDRTQRAHDVNITSPQRRCNVMTLHRRWGDVIFTSCACRECTKMFKIAHTAFTFLLYGHGFHCTTIQYLDIIL